MRTIDVNAFSSVPGVDLKHWYIEMENVSVHLINQELTVPLSSQSGGQGGGQGLQQPPPLPFPLP